MRRCITFVRFTVSGLTSFLIDVILFAFIVRLFDVNTNFVFGPVAIATTIARIISAHYNYLCNRFLVFKTGSGHESYVKYFCLVLVIGATSWLFTSLLARVIASNGLAVTIVKIVVDICLFIASFFAQRKFVFNSKVE